MDISFLFNKNGKLEAQRISKSWFSKHGHSWKLFEENGITDSKSLYMFLHAESDLCECGNKRRFIGFKDGFKTHCERCARTKYNWMKGGKNTDVSINNLLEFVKDTKGNYSSVKIKLLSPNTLNELALKTSHLTSNASIIERLYNLENKLTSLPVCTTCGKEHDNFYFSSKGYNRTHKGKCARIYDDAVKRLMSIRAKKTSYSKYVKQFKSNNEYIVKIFSFDEYINGDPEVTFVHKECGTSYSRKLSYQGHLRCPKCYPIRSKIQYEIFEWLKQSIKCSMNDRKTIQPLELDILTPTFAIEYDSIMYHSTGKSSFSRFDNIVELKNQHLHKTELCEQQGIQLFRIFSNEWHNKGDIWKSVINSKVGGTNRIFARKCSVKEISSDVSKKFIEKNHLQGNLNASVRLGLFYNSELIAVMTFGKARRAKWKGINNYELLRFCSTKNLTVVGGAGKLLKYFERKYNPHLIISYANRRWSIGTLYEKLGFQFMYNTDPNYFYFKGGDNSKLHSREQFQKHKLKDKLEKFNPNLTETENMYNNGYRKIYDCGNKVYVKTYQ